MSETFILSFRIRNSYRANGIVYRLRSLPLLRRVLSENLYSNKAVKGFANIAALLAELSSLFVWKILYILLFIVLPSMAPGVEASTLSLHALFFLSWAGTVTNTPILNPGKDTYYALFLLRMDARDYTLANFIYFLFKTLLGFWPVIVVYALITDLNLFAAFLFPLYVASLKCLRAVWVLRLTLRQDKKSEQVHQAVDLILIVLSLAAAYIIPFTRLAFSQTILTGTMLFFILTAVISFRFLWRFKLYRRTWKNSFNAQENLLSQSVNLNSIKRDQYANYLENGAGSTKSGYEFFNDIFVKRHRRLLLRWVKWKTIGIASAVVLVSVFTVFVPEARSDVNRFLSEYFSYSLFAMYLLDCGRSYSEALFMNCDHSMLTYRFYRQPDVILHLFRVRLKSLVKMNLLPASLLTIGLPFLLFWTGGTTYPLTYLVMPLSILAQSVFFSVHSLVIYYLLQPYNIGLENRNYMFSIVNTATYFVCYMVAGMQMTTAQFGLITAVFSVLYTPVAFFLAYKKAPQTFRLRD